MIRRSNSGSGPSLKTYMDARWSRSLSRMSLRASCGTLRVIISQPWPTTSSPQLRWSFTLYPSHLRKDPSLRPRVSFRPCSSTPQSPTSLLLHIRQCSSTIFRSSPWSTSTSQVQSGSPQFPFIPRVTTSSWEPMTRRLCGLIWTWAPSLIRT